MQNAAVNFMISSMPSLRLIYEGEICFNKQKIAWDRPNIHKSSGSYAFEMFKVTTCVGVADPLSLPGKSRAREVARRGLEVHLRGSNKSDF